MHPAVVYPVPFPSSNVVDEQIDLGEQLRGWRCVLDNGATVFVTSYLTYSGKFAPKRQDALLARFRGTMGVPADQGELSTGKSRRDVVCDWSLPHEFCALIVYGL